MTTHFTTLNRDWDRPIICRKSLISGRGPYNNLHVYTKFSFLLVGSCCSLDEDCGTFEKRHYSSVSIGDSSEGLSKSQDCKYRFLLVTSGRGAWTDNTVCLLGSEVRWTKRTVRWCLPCTARYANSGALYQIQ